MTTDKTLTHTFNYEKIIKANKYAIQVDVGKPKPVWIPKEDITAHDIKGKWLTVMSWIAEREGLI